MFDNPITVPTGTDAGRFQSQLIAAGLPVAYINVSGTQGDVFTTAALTQAQLTALATIAAQQGPRVGRLLYAIGTSIAALSTSQWTNVDNAFFAGSIPASPPAWLLHAGPNIAALGAIYVLAVTGAYTQTSLTKAQKIGVMAMICQDSVNTLVNPVFDPSIVVAGDQPAS